MSYKVLDPKGIGYSHEGGVTIIPKDGTLEDRLITDGSFRQEFIEVAIAQGRLISLGEKQVPVIAPENRKMPEAEIKKESKKNKKGK